MRLIIWAVIAAPSSAEASREGGFDQGSPLKLGRVPAEWARPGLIHPLVGGQDVAQPGWRAGEDAVRSAVSFEMPKAMVLNHQK